jgi:hypothetical protein
MAELEAWEQAWAAGGSPTGRRVFPPALLHDPEIAVLGRAGAKGFDAGCIVNLSPDVAGLSNVFSTAEQSSAVFEEATAAAVAFAPGRPLVGYEHGAELDAAVAAGFGPAGKLRVWLRD